MHNWYFYNVHTNYVYSMGAQVSYSLFVFSDTQTSFIWRSRLCIKASACLTSRRTWKLLLFNGSSSWTSSQISRDTCTCWTNFRVFSLPSSSSSLRPSLLSTVSELPHPPPSPSSGVGFTYSSTDTSFHSQPASPADVSWPIYFAGTGTSRPSPGYITTESQWEGTAICSPSGAIQESLGDINDVIARCPSLKGAKLPTLLMKLAKEAVFGEMIMK